jgi:homocysteine S-methyltransferase
MDLLVTRPRVRAMFAMACKNETSINSGESIIDAVKLIEQKDFMNQVESIGINCTAPEYISELLRKIRPHTNKLIVVYPNSGEKFNPKKIGWEKGDNKIFNEDDGLKAWGEITMEWRRLGANIIGGCCQIMPCHIKKL